MTPEQIKRLENVERLTVQKMREKIESLDWWLTEHPTDPNYSNVLQDKIKLEQDLNIIENHEYDE